MCRCVGYALSVRVHIIGIPVTTQPQSHKGTKDSENNPLDTSFDERDIELVIPLVPAFVPLRLARPTA